MDKNETMSMAKRVLSRALISPALDVSRQMDSHRSQDRISMQSHGTPIQHIRPSNVPSETLLKYVVCAV